MVKLRELISIDNQIPLPIIVDCAEGSAVAIEKQIQKKHQVKSIYYQTSKLSCKISQKPIHITKNES